jgi:cellulose synthase/poly-beta-1,6-N-acetylglucosamine synthase-like glycosyltransferase
LSTTSLVLILILGVTYVGYPLLIAALASLRRLRPPRGGTWPSVSIIVPCHNEAAVIERKVRDCLAQAGPDEPVEVLVGCDGCTDNTAELARRVDDPRVRVFESPERLGKSAVMAECVQIANGDILLFTDADAVMRPGSVKQLVRWFADPRVGVVSGAVKYTGADGSHCGRGEQVYWTLEGKLREATGGAGWLLGACGPLFAIRRACYRPMGEGRGDDFELGMAARLTGYLAVYEPEASVTTSYHPTGKSQFRRKVRIVSWFFRSGLVILGAALRQRRFGVAAQMLMQKILRWFSPAVALLLWASLIADGGICMVLASTSLVLFLGASLRGYITDRRGKAGGMCGFAYYIAVTTAAALVGVLKAALPMPSRQLWDPGVQRR